MMMNGEFDFEETFNPTTNCSNLPPTFNCTNPQIPSYLPITSQIIYVGFVLIISMLLGNLLISLAVNELQDLLHDAKLTKNKTTMDLLLSIEYIIRTFGCRRLLYIPSAAYILPNDSNRRDSVYAEGRFSCWTGIRSRLCCRRMWSDSAIEQSLKLDEETRMTLQEIALRRKVGLKAGYEERNELFSTKTSKTVHLKRCGTRQVKNEKPFLGRSGDGSKDRKACGRGFGLQRVQSNSTSDVVSLDEGLENRLKAIENNIVNRLSALLERSARFSRLGGTLCVPSDSRMSRLDNDPASDNLLLEQMTQFGRGSASTGISSLHESFHRLGSSVRSIPKHNAVQDFWNSLSDNQQKFALAGACSLGLLVVGLSANKLLRNPSPAVIESTAVGNVPSGDFIQAAISAAESVIKSERLKLEEALCDSKSGKKRQHSDNENAVEFHSGKTRAIERKCDVDGRVKDVHRKRKGCTAVVSKVSNSSAVGKYGDFSDTRALEETQQTNICQEIVHHQESKLTEFSAVSRSSVIEIEQNLNEIEFRKSISSSKIGFTAQMPATAAAEANNNNDNKVTSSAAITGPASDESPDIIKFSEPFVVTLDNHADPGDETWNSLKLDFSAISGAEIQRDKFAADQTEDCMHRRMSTLLHRAAENKRLKSVPNKEPEKTSPTLWETKFLDRGDYALENNNLLNKCEAQSVVDSSWLDTSMIVHDGLSKAIENLDVSAMSSPTIKNILVKDDLISVEPLDVQEKCPQNEDVEETESVKDTDKKRASKYLLVKAENSYSRRKTHIARKKCRRNFNSIYLRSQLKQIDCTPSGTTSMSFSSLTSKGHRVFQHLTKILDKIAAANEKLEKSAAPQSEKRNKEEIVGEKVMAEISEIKEVMQSIKMAVFSLCVQQVAGLQNQPVKSSPAAPQSWTTLSGLLNEARYSAYLQRSLVVTTAGDAVRVGEDNLDGTDTLSEFEHLLSKSHIHAEQCEQLKRVPLDTQPALPIVNNVAVSPASSAEHHTNDTGLSTCYLSSDSAPPIIEEVAAEAADAVAVVCAKMSDTLFDASPLEYDSDQRLNRQTENKNESPANDFHDDRSEAGSHELPYDDAPQNDTPEEAATAAAAAASVKPGSSPAETKRDSVVKNPAEKATGSNADDDELPHSVIPQLAAGSSIENAPKRDDDYDDGAQVDASPCISPSLISEGTVMEMKQSEVIVTESFQPSPSAQQNASHEPLVALRKQSSFTRSKRGRIPVLSPARKPAVGTLDGVPTGGTTREPKKRRTLEGTGVSKSPADGRRISVAPAIRTKPSR
ncbi:unnamed protein product [Notodromas monacha]|uniref:Uncharacterized protein n=1 Tax=Notodromas monacha TaxID=399045 RepID=A0A7R9C0Y4_9CRUS|nr:unnamed protein product [Notodromas monacha]CAG0923776.1 unnamed protein product [Notodromas monacha]